jgi:GABA(A) receptor-associated protein
MAFKGNFDFNQRLNESSKIMVKYPSRIPIIVEKFKDCTLNDIDKTKYLVPKDLNMNQFVYVIRKRIKLEPSQSIFLMVNGQLCPSNMPISSIYEDLSDEDGFLYITYTSENTFG